MAKITTEQMNILINIIGAVETGGQIYGCQRYDDYTPAYTNSSSEVSCTIGAFQEYNWYAKALLQEILDTYPNTFNKYDTAGIKSDLKKSSWVGYSPARGSSKAKAIQAIISSPDGIKVQNKRIERLLNEYIAFAEKQGVTSVDALFMCANWIHQGGNSACTRLLKKCGKPYTLDRLYEACKTDTGNQVGAYKSRQAKVYGWIKAKVSNTNIKEETNINIIEKAINLVISIAKNEVGYLEKASNSNLDSKTGNAGYNNYTKYWRDVYPSYQAQAWCACFVSWIFMTAFGLETAKKLLKHWPYVYCPTLGSLFTKHANPQVGDIVIFYRNGTFAHTGIVTKVEGDRFWTIEGNTSGLAGIVANGGGVFEKSYYNSQLPGTKFCRPDYSIITSVNTPSSPTSTSPSNPSKNWLEYGDTGNDVKVLQQKLNKLGFKGKNGIKLTEDGEYGENTKYAVLQAQKAYNLTCDGIAGKNTITALDDAIKKLGTSSGSSTTSSYKAWVGACNADNSVVYKASTGSTVLSSYPKLNKGNLVNVIGKSGNRYKIKIADKYTGYISISRITTPDKVSSNEYPFVGKCTANNVAVRKGAGTNYEQISGYPIINKGNLVDVTSFKTGSDGKKWYYVLIAKKYKGYVRSDFISK